MLSAPFGQLGSAVSAATGRMSHRWVSDRWPNRINLPIFYRQKD
ncbi:MAG: hypothetical protein ACFB12_25490 [Leptolyngbyaceae cyanobacterium]